MNRVVKNERQLQWLTLTTRWQKEPFRAVSGADCATGREEKRKDLDMHTRVSCCLNRFCSTLQNYTFLHHLSWLTSFISSILPQLFHAMISKHSEFEHSPHLDSRPRCSPETWLPTDLLSLMSKHMSLLYPCMWTGTSQDRKPTRTQNGTRLNCHCLI